MESEISNSILETVKKLVGVDIDYGVYDIDLIVAINSSFMILHQLGVGPEKPFTISDSSATWQDFFGDEEVFALAKSYIYLRTRLLFDPPSSGVLHEAVERQISEFEWRMQVQADYNDSKEESEKEEAETTPIDHTTLINRDAEDQHPIGSVTGLRDKLDTIPEIMTQQDLKTILEKR